MIELLDGELDALISMPTVGKRRHRLTRRVQIYYLGNGVRESWWAKTQNISQEGVAVVVARPFEVGILLTFEVESGRGIRHCRLEGRVVHATPKDLDLWLVGCKLSATLSETELLEFLDDA